MTLFYAFKYDIKEFFTNVVIAHVMPAIDFFLHKNELLNGGIIWVHKRNKKIIFFQQPKLARLFYEIKTEVIVEIIKFDMNNAWFLLGDGLIGKQKEGLSIGGFLSSMLAIMLANYAEHTTVTNSLYSMLFMSNQTQILDGVRATDDGLIFVALDRSKKETFKSALEVLKKFKKEFVKNMGGKTVLEFDKVSVYYTYLENTIYNVYSDIFISFCTKNYESLVKTGKQKIIKGAHINSVTATEIKLNTLSQTFKRIKEGCTLDCFAYLCAQKFIYEVIKGYKWPVDWIATALKKIANHKSQNMEFWIGIYFQIKQLVKKSKLVTNVCYDVFCKKLESLISSNETSVQNVILSARHKCYQGNKKAKAEGKKSRTEVTRLPRIMQKTVRIKKVPII